MKAGVFLYVRANKAVHLVAGVVDQGTRYAAVGAFAPALCERVPSGGDWTIMSRVFRQDLCPGCLARYAKLQGDDWRPLVKVVIDERPPAPVQMRMEF